MDRLATEVISHISQMPEGVPVAAKELLHLGNRAAVDQTLSRLHRRGSLIRIGRGLYVRPVEGRFGTRPPESAKVVQALVERHQEQVVPYGAAAANELGLSTQVPVREVYLTSGPTRKINLGEQVVEFRHAPAWQLVLPGRQAGSAIRALAWIGADHADRIIDTLKSKLAPSERTALLDLRSILPSWMAQLLSRLASNA